MIFARVHLRAAAILASSVALYVFVAPLAVLSREVPITILCTTDLHGHLLPSTDYDGNKNRGGLARCATRIRQIRNQERHVLLLDAGDTIQGDAVSFLSDGLVMIKALNELRYDAWVPGNHEFDWGLEKLAACVEAAEMPVLNANLHDHPDLPASFPSARIAARVRPFIMREVDGVRVAIIGLNTPGIPNWSRPRLIAGIHIADSVDRLRQLMPLVKRERPDIIVLVCHQGYRAWGDDHANQVRAIAANFPELDVILGGHTHQHVAEFKVCESLYCQPGYHGSHLGQVSLVYDTDKRRLVTRQSRTWVMDETVPLDVELLTTVGPELERAEKALAQAVGAADAAIGLQGAPKRESPVHNLVFESLAHALSRHGVTPDVIVHGILNDRAVLAPGPITVGDVWELIPYENTIGVARLLPSELRVILDENAGAYNSSRFRGVWGVRWTFDPDAPEGQRVLGLERMDGTPLDDSAGRLTVAFNSYDLASGGGRWTRLRAIVDGQPAGLVEFDFQTRQAVIDYIRHRGTVSPVIRGWWKTATGKASSPLAISAP
jgi:2',3'-cyclic-nucleotide 2'-phosphodiesterase (5'-nucleotidase family)